MPKYKMTKLATYNLTPKQERFAQEYIKTGNASQAYRIAYDTENMKPATINRKAAELTDNGKIAARIGELQAKTEQQTIMSVVRRKERLSEIAEDKKRRDNIQAIAELNKMEHVYDTASHTQVNIDNRRIEHVEVVLDPRGLESPDGGSRDDD
jgi:phage terminase small subunit